MDGAAIGALGDTAGRLPRVSVVVPCLNEASTICSLLDALAGQTYPAELVEVIVADGGSADGTRGLLDLVVERGGTPPVRVIDNPRRIVPAALNVAMAAATGDVLVRIDAHALPAPDYVEQVVAALAEGRGDVVGGVLEVRPQRRGAVAHGIAVAACSPVGVGDALYRFTARAQQVDTVPFASFHRAVVARVGPYDEALPVNEDYEFNARVRRAGGRVWLDPRIRSTYLTRPTLRALGRQYVRYGFWKARMLRRHPETVRARQALPPLFVLSAGLLAGASLRVPPARRLLAAQVVPWAVILAGTGVRAALRHRRPPLAAAVPAAIATMHLSYGAGFLASAASLAARGLPPRPARSS